MCFSFGFFGGLGYVCIQKVLSWCGGEYSFAHVPIKKNYIAKEAHLRQY